MKLLNEEESSSAIRRPTSALPHLSDDALKKVAAADEIIFSMKNKKVAQTLQENEKA
ncbi:MAG: hypothetical protein IKO38_01230 [Erysipelotrichaceae bacterium]|nr:hypothetical protein [Erysipelotrichaceae bacterium]